ncbi:GDP-L-fucose synthase family protein [Mariniblastus fucicola]|nr:GDP-L-fucose synthase [Mariniblastus fucicola]
MQDWSKKRAFVSGHRGMVGGAVVRALQASNCGDIVTRTRAELDLCDQAAVNSFFAESKIDVVIFCAGKVGGIHANNTYPAEFMHQNLSMAVNSIDAAYRNQVSRFLYLGSTCIYPGKAPQPMTEDSLLTSPLEKTNEAYALAKIAGLKMCEFYRRQYNVLFHSTMPTNLYGPGDNYHPENSHVLPALVRRFHEAKESNADSVSIWGTGTPRREFLHVDDLASGLLHLCSLADPPDLVNVGTGSDISILELATKVAEVVGFQGEIVTDPTKPDGTMVKRTDMTLMQSTGWQASISLDDGLRQAYADFLAEVQQGVLREV